jgi:hypothetical protein
MVGLLLGQCQVVGTWQPGRRGASASKPHAAFNVPCAFKGLRDRVPGTGGSSTDRREETGIRVLDEDAPSRKQLELDANQLVLAPSWAVHISDVDCAPEDARSVPAQPAFETARGERAGGATNLGFPAANMNLHQ